MQEKWYAVILRRELLPKPEDQLPEQQVVGCLTQRRASSCAAEVSHDSHSF